MDEKNYLTDTLDTEGIFRLIESIPSPKAEPFKLWLAKLGKEKIDEVFDSSKGIDQMIDLEIAITNIGELATREIAKNEKLLGLSENRKAAKRGGGVAMRTKDFFEEETGSKVISQSNALNYKYDVDNKLIEKQEFYG